MKSSQTKSYDSSLQFDEQQFKSMVKKFTNQYDTQKRIDVAEYINEAKGRTQKNLFDFRINKTKNNMESTADNAIHKYTQIRQSQLLQQIKELRQDNMLLQNHFDLLNQKYQQKRQEANQCLMQYNDLSSKYEILSEKYMNIEQNYRQREKNLIDSLNYKISQSENKFKQQSYALQSKIRELEQHNKYFQQIVSKTQSEYQKIKQILELQKSKRKQKQKQYNERNQALNKQINHYREQIVHLKNQIGHKNIKIQQKSEQLVTLEKALRQMNQRVNKVKNQSQKQIMKERAITKKAVDGLKMTRKYSQMQLSKSRKKQKQYLHNQKQLIGKIKEIYKQQSVMQATDKWQRKSSIRSLNTTLKLSKPDRQTCSPFVSNFVAEQDNNGVDLSPINKIEHPKNDYIHLVKDNGLEKSKSTARLIKTRHKIDIPNIQVDQSGIGTPCFELQNDKMFRASKQQKIIKAI